MVVQLLLQYNADFNICDKVSYISLNLVINGLILLLVSETLISIGFITRWQSMKLND